MFSAANLATDTKVYISTNGKLIINYTKENTIRSACLFLQVSSLKTRTNSKVFSSTEQKNKELQNSKFIDLFFLCRRLIEKLELDIPDELVEGTIHMKPDAAELLIQIVYNRVTNRVIKSVPVDHEIDFSGELMFNIFSS